MSDGMRNERQKKKADGHYSTAPARAIAMDERGAKMLNRTVLKRAERGLRAANRPFRAAGLPRTRDRADPFHGMTAGMRNDIDAAPSVPGEGASSKKLAPQKKLESGDLHMKKL